MSLFPSSLLTITFLATQLGATAAGTTIGVVGVVLVALIVIGVMVRRARVASSNMKHPLVQGVSLNTPATQEDFVAMHDLEAWEESDIAPKEAAASH